MSNIKFKKNPPVYLIFTLELFMLIVFNIETLN